MCKSRRVSLYKSEGRLWRLPQASPASNQALREREEATTIPRKQAPILVRAAAPLPKTKPNLFHS